MTEIILFILALSILFYHACYVREVNKERKQLVDALIARTAAELRDLRVAENTKIKIEPPKTGSDLVSLEDLDDEAFLKANKETYGK